MTKLKSKGRRGGGGVRKRMLVLDIGKSICAL